MESILFIVLSIFVMVIFLFSLLAIPLGMIKTSPIKLQLFGIHVTILGVFFTWNSVDVIGFPLLIFGSILGIFGLFWSGVAKKGEDLEQHKEKKTYD